MAEKSLKEKTAKGLLWGGINNGVQQLLILVFGLFLARILSPADYGVIGMLGIFTGLASTLQEGGFISALTNRPEIKHEDYNSVFWFNIFCGIILYVFLYFSAPYIAAFYEVPDLVGVSRILFLSFLFGSFGISQQAYLFKNLKVKERAQIDIYPLIISNIVALIMALNGMSYWGIAIQISLYAAINNILKWYFSPWRPTFNFSIQPIREMFPFSIKLVITNIFTQISNNIFSVLLGKFYTESQVGYFTQSNKWMTMGKGLITGMITGVAQPVFSQINHEKERQVYIFRKLLRFSVFISFPMMFGLAFISHEFILITVTEKWLPCVPILQLLCIWGAFSPIADLYKNMIVSKGKSNIYLWINIIFSIIQFMLIYAVIPYGIMWMVGMYTLAYFIYLFIWHYYLNKLLVIRGIDIIKDISPYLVTSLFAIGCTYYITSLITNLYLLLPAK